jgi:hypothetical protein
MGTEHDRLARVERLIADEERNVARQSVVVERLQANGGDARMADRVLEAFESSLTAHRVERDMIRAKIAKGHMAEK